jgi:hypothetical protein
MRFLSNLFGRKADETQRVFKWTLTPFEARARAQMMVKSAAKLCIELNYSSDSLADIDMLIDKERETGIVTTKEMCKVLLWLGAYSGEVLVRNLGGKWQRGSGAPDQDPLVLVINGTYAINVVSMVFRRFVLGEPHSIARMYEEVVKLREKQEA